MTDPLLRFRGEFPILDKTVYLISNSLGAMPRAAEEALERYASDWKTRGVRAWAESWWDLSAAVGDEIAPLLGAPPGTVSMLANVTTAQAVLLSSFEYRKGRDKIVLAEGEFPSVRYLYENLAPRFGARVEVVPSPHGDGLSIDEERIAAAIDDSTVLVPISHVLFRSAYVADLAPIVKKARRVGAIVVLDAYQSVGTLPVDVGELQVDVLIGGVLKWLCGGPGAAFLYVSEDLRARIKPSLTGWFAHRRPFAFEEAMDWRDDAFRFLLGTPPIPALYAAREGPRIIREAGIGAIREKSLRQTGIILDRARARNFAVSAPTDPERRGGTAAIDFPNSLEVSRELNRRDVCVDYRPGAGIRMSPHFYNTDEEIARAFEEIDTILSEEAWRRWVQDPGLVT
jgi:kynureninase